MTPTSEFSHIVTVDPWPADGITVKLAATDAECLQLQERFGLVGLPSLEAEGIIEREGRDLIFRGKIRGDVVQTCVVTLEPVPASIETAFERRYSRDSAGAVSMGSEVAFVDEEADIEVLETDHIDIGAVIAEEFYLALEPYPRADHADAVMARVQGNLDDEVTLLQESPFAKLRRH